MQVQIFDLQETGKKCGVEQRGVPVVRMAVLGSASVSKTRDLRKLKPTGFAQCFAARPDLLQSETRAKFWRIFF